MQKKLVNVIVSGFPLPLASNVVKACATRGFTVVKQGLALDEIKEDAIDIPDFGKISLLKLSDQNNIKTKLLEIIDGIRKEKGFPIIADVSNLPQVS